MKRLLGITVALLLTAAPAHADNDYERDGDEDSGNGSGDCAGATAACEDNDASPSFDKSPVEDSFNIQICVQPGSCSEDDKEASL